MHSIRAFKKLFRRTFTDNKAKGTQPPAGPSSAKSAPTAQASPNANGAASTAAPRAAPSPAASRPITANHAGRATVQDEYSRSSDSSSAEDERPKLQPKRQRERRRLPSAQYTRPNYAAQVVFEEFNNPNDPMPEGYAGTLGGIRYGHSAVEDYCPCGIGGGHFLTCGHIIVAVNEACGTNCKTASHEVQPFNCPQCHGIVNDVLKNDLTMEERAKIDYHYTRRDGISFALAVEYVTKNLPVAQRNITETVFGIMSPGYGRECLAVPVGAKKPSTLAEMHQEHHSILEEKTRVRLAEEKLGPLKTSEKRRASEELAESPDSPEAETPEVADRMKKQKKTLETHSEPVTEQTRGIKRAALHDGDIPDEQTSSGDSASPAANTSKKLKTKLETHRQPITIRTRGMKRKQFKVDTAVNSPRATKRVMSSFPSDIGRVAFWPIPPVLSWFWPIPPETPATPATSGTPEPLGLLERKRQQDLQDEEGHSSKRWHSFEVLPGSDVEVAPLRPKRFTLEEYVAATGDDEL